MTKKGSGRLKGSYSFVTITLAQLNAKFAPETPIVIGRKWGEAVGFQGLTASPAIKPIASAKPAVAASSTPIGASVVDLNQ